MHRYTLIAFLLVLLSCRPKQNIIKISDQEIKSDSGNENSASSIEIELDDGVCPEGMALVDHDYCTNMSFTCLKYTDEESAKKHHKHPRICSEFKKPGICKGKVKHMKFCMDKCEVPGCGERPKL